MALTESRYFELGRNAPAFTLPDTVSGKNISLQDVKGAQGTFVMFICNHCPYVLHINEQLIQIAKDYRDKGIGFVAISSNDVAHYPQDGPDKMKERAQELGYPFPYLYDDTQDVAREYAAACTPDLYLFDKDLKLYYHGQLDDSRPGNEEPQTGRDMRLAIDNMLMGKAWEGDQRPSVGCNIKWRL